VTKTTFIHIEILAHHLPHQRKIAWVLSAYDDLIENNTRRIAILEEMAKTLYRDWFVRFRFPGHENVPLVTSPLGEIPEGWKAGTISDLGRLVTGKTPSNCTFRNSPSLTPPDLATAQRLPEFLSR
jgi:type I restriction enzyme S subunit